MSIDLVSALSYERAAHYLDTLFDHVFTHEPALRATLDDAFRVGYLAAINDLETRAQEIRTTADTGPHALTWTPFDDTRDGVCD